MHRWLILKLLILVAPVVGCGSSYTIDRAFVSDKNHCFPDYVNIPVPTLVDPTSQSLSSTSNSTPTYAQSMTVASDQWTYGLQLRFILSTIKPDVSVDLFKVGNDGSEPFTNITKTMPDGRTGTFIASADLDTSNIESSETWMDFAFKVPPFLKATETYWGLVIVRDAGIYWTITQGTNFSSYDAGSWTVASGKQGTIRSLACEQL